MRKTCQVFESTSCPSYKIVNSLSFGVTVSDVGSLGNETQTTEGRDTRMFPVRRRSRPDVDVSSFRRDLSRPSTVGTGSEWTGNEVGVKECENFVCVGST